MSCNLKKYMLFFSNTLHDIVGLFIITKDLVIQQPSPLRLSAPSAICLYRELQHALYSRLEE